MHLSTMFMYTQAWAFWDQSFQDFATIEKFLCVQIFTIDSSVNLTYWVFDVTYIKKK